MATIEQYREYIQTLLEKYRSPKISSGEIETQLIADTQHDHYQLVNIGWKNGRRIYNCIIHIDIKDGKVWLQHNLTDLLVAEDLVAAGIPKDQIVLGFHPPYVRKHTEFAVY